MSDDRESGPALSRKRWMRIGAAGALLAAASAAAVLLALHGEWFADGHRDMRERLARLAAAQGTWDNPWDLQDRKIASLREQLASERDMLRRLVVQREIAQQYLNGGSPEPAIALLESLVAEYAGRLSPQDVATLKGDIAFAYFRIGEQQNCASGPNANVCIVPLEGNGIHRNRLGATEAASRYEALLADPAVDADSAVLYRWLLNVAYMQLGRYPHDVPARWLIAPSVFASAHDVGRFRDVAGARGLVEFGRAGGAVLEDFDNDGHLDLLVSHMGHDDSMAYFSNAGDGTFVRRTREARLDGLLGGLNMVQADFDNDGCIDVYVPRGAWFHDKGRFPASLLRNRCDGTFEDVTARAGVLNELPSQTAVWADFDNDGRVDLFVGNEIVRDKVPWPADAANFRLYRNQGDGRFADVSAATGIDVHGMVKGVAADDFDNDGRMDLYVSVMGGPNRLFRNAGPGAGGAPRFDDVTATAGVGEPAMSFTTWFFDHDNDGWPDLFVSGYQASIPAVVREMLGDKANAPGARARLYRNNRDGTFTDVAPAQGLDLLLLTMGANFGDLDNDGWLDFYAGTGAAPLINVVPNRMFRNDAGRRFQDVTVSGGFGHLQKGHAVAFGDVDGDGQQDVFANIGGAMSGDRFYSVLFHNPGHDHGWLRLDLVGRQANRYAIGARVRVRITEAGRVRDIWRTVGSGGSFGASSLRTHVGLGQARAADEIEIRWPGSGLVQTLAGPFPSGGRYEIVEGSAPRAVGAPVVAQGMRHKP